MNSKVFTADQANLFHDGAVTLPRKAVEFAQQCQRIHATAATGGTQFTGAQTDLAVQWNNLRNLLQELCGRTADNLETTGAVLVRVVEDYAETDSAASAQLEEQRKRLDDPNIQSAPKYIPPRPRPGDPQGDVPPGPGVNRPS